MTFLLQRRPAGNPGITTPTDARKLKSDQADAGSSERKR
jgi:hypothetical protein